jgi:nitroreductase
MNETLKLIKSRRSTRAYKPQQITEDELQAILEAGVYAPSATNRQPWHFTVIQNKELIDLLSEKFKLLAKQSDSAYLRRVGENEKFHVFHHAPTVIVISGDEKNSSAPVDCAAATQNMLIQAESMGIGTCWVGFISYYLNSNEGREHLKELGIPEGYRQIHSVAVGYKLNEPLAAPARKDNCINYIR